MQGKRQLFFWVSILAVIALVIRFVHLGDKPLHHDESLHAFYSFEFFRGNGYTYNPITHGPLLYYVTAAADWLVGVSDGAVRTGTALFGWILVLLPLIWRRAWGWPATIAAMTLLAFSPNMLYLSRFLRHDPLMHVWTFGLVIALVGYIQTKRSSLLLVMGLLSGLAFSTSETSFITFFMLASFLFGGALAEKIFKRSGMLGETVRTLGKQWPTLLGAVGIFIATSAILYSTFFTSKEGFLTAIPNPWNPQSGLGYWLAQHDVHRGGQPWYYYLITLSLYEYLTLIMGLIGIVWLLRRKATLIGGILIWWFVVFFGVYSWAGEKFPWLTTYPLLPLILIAAYALGRQLEAAKFRMRPIIVLLLLLGLLTTTFSALRLSFKNPANPAEVAVYVQTTKDVVRVADVIAADARLIGAEVADAHVDGELTWPFAWYLRDGAIRSYEQTLSAPPQAKYVLVSEANETAWQPYLNDYRKIGGGYDLRAWWIPPTYSEKPYIVAEVANYFVSRQIWGNGIGAVKFSFYERSQ